jgi:glucokinase
MSSSCERPFSGYVLGLDIGGTEIKAALVNGKGNILASHRSPTPRTLREIRYSLRLLIGKFRLAAKEIRAVGIGCKGIIDPETTEVLALPGDLHYLEGQKLNALIVPAVPTSCPVAADNDARVALVGEHQWGAARGRQNAIMLTLGTGVGGAILADGKILRGAGGVAGHLGHLTVQPDGPVCICGSRGCLETIFSARALEAEAFAAMHLGVKSRLFNSQLRPPSCEEVFDCARKGDKIARLVVERAVTVLGGAIAGLVHAFDPEIVILGGQITRAGDLLFAPVQHEVNWRTKTLLRRKVPVVKAQVADPSGVVGAAALAIESIAIANNTTRKRGILFRQ